MFSKESPPTVIIYTDIGKDIDDTINAIVALTLLEKGFIHKLVFVTCGGAEAWRVDELNALIEKFKFRNDNVFVIPGKTHSPPLSEKSQYNVLHGTKDTKMFGDCSLQSALVGSSATDVDEELANLDTILSNVNDSFYICICGVVSADSYMDIHELVQGGAHVCVQGALKQDAQGSICFQGYNIASPSGTDCLNDAEGVNIESFQPGNKNKHRQGTATLAQMVSSSKTTFFIAGGTGDSQKVTANLEIYNSINDRMENNLFKKQTAGFLINMHRSSKGDFQAGVNFDGDKYSGSFWNRKTDQSGAITQIGSNDFRLYVPKSILSKEDILQEEIVRQWNEIRESQTLKGYSEVVQMARDTSTKPDPNVLMTRCVDFPMTTGEQCTANSTHLPNNITGDDSRMKQCTQLGFQCVKCEGLVAFDGGAKPNEANTYDAYCNKECTNKSTFTPEIGPCDLMKICHGFDSASIYAYNDKYIAVHDYGNLAPVHFLIIPTSVAIPDVLSMCVNRGDGTTYDGPAIIDEMKCMALNIFRKMCGLEPQSDDPKTVYAPNLKIMGEMYSLTGEDVKESKIMDDGLPEKMLAAFNMPVSQNQLHLHIIVLPFFASQMTTCFSKNNFGNRRHWGWPRTVPLKLVERVIAGNGIEKVHAGAKQDAKATVKDSFGPLMCESSAIRIVGSGEGLENKRGSDWYQYCWRRLEKAHNWKIETFLSEDHARNDVLVLPQCFYHRNEKEEMMDEWLGGTYRERMNKFIETLTKPKMELNANEGQRAKVLSAAELVEENIDSDTGLIRDTEAYFNLLSKTEYLSPKPNVVSEYFRRRLMRIPV